MLKKLFISYRQLVYQQQLPNLRSLKRYAVTTRHDRPKRQRIRLRNLIRPHYVYSIGGCSGLRYSQGTQEKYAMSHYQLGQNIIKVPLLKLDYLYESTGTVKQVSVFSRSQEFMNNDEKDQNGYFVMRNQFNNLCRKVEQCVTKQEVYKLCSKVEQCVGKQQSHQLCHKVELIEKRLTKNLRIIKAIDSRQEQNLMILFL